MRYTLDELKEAFHETIEERPEALGRLAWGAGITALCLYNFGSVIGLNRKVRNLTKAVISLDNNSKILKEALVAHNYIDTAEIAATDAMVGKIANKVGIPFQELRDAADIAYKNSMAKQMSLALGIDDMPKLDTMRF